MGARTVLIEGGAMLNYAALSEGVVDEIYLTIV
ncbi:MAG: 2,5-diamino-6-(ribosylamino)-4(3H)-pyrimidinone 5'-phosphate reductase, partial [Thermotogae bacterium]